MVRGLMGYGGVVLALMMSATVAPRVNAKPPDLPVQMDRVCQQGDESVTTQTECIFINGLDHPVACEVHRVQKTAYGLGVNWFWDQVVRALNGGQIPAGPVDQNSRPEIDLNPNPNVQPIHHGVPAPDQTCPRCPGLHPHQPIQVFPLPPLDNVPDSVQATKEAQRCYDLAEQEMKLGNVASAYNYYQISRWHSPDGRVAQSAVKKLDAIDRMRSSVAVKKAPQKQYKPANAKERYLQQVKQAQEMYHIGERCRKKGDLEMARNCYDETRRICPESDYARLAAEKMQSINSLEKADDAEAAESREQLPDQQVEAPSAEPVFIPFFPGLYVYPQGSRQSDSNSQDLIEHEEREHEARAVDYDVRAWAVRAVNALMGSTQCDLDADASRQGCVRIRGAVFFSGLGCELICDANQCKVSISASGSK